MFLKVKWDFHLSLSEKKRLGRALEWKRAYEPVCSSCSVAGSAGRVSLTCSDGCCDCEVQVSLVEMRAKEPKHL